ncbi:apyrase [Onthophagus taurus]|uniref:apyrase n=1 Tax=Onthophagus taurus TaxID=166361 RepID=UPI0039BE7D18
MISLTKGLIIVGVIVVIAVVSSVTAVLLTGNDDLEEEYNFRLSIIHLNDFHARFEETSTDSGSCKSNECIGGISRVYTAVNQLRESRVNPIFLNAGDNFQGTLWYNLFKWNVTAHFWNILEPNVTTLGNHEFDDKIEGLVPFLNALNSPIVVSNIDDSEEPTMQGLYEKSTVLEVDGRKIGVVGVILSTTNEIASTEKLKFLDESESVNKEAERLFNEEGVFTVIVLSHCGYEVDQEIARKAIPGISVIVGAHSHTLLYNGTPPNGIAYGPYPTLIENEEGQQILIVQASAYTKYLGDLIVDYDENGNVINYEGSPIYLDHTVQKDEMIDELLTPWKEEVDASGNRLLGHTNVHLDQSSCRTSECNLGNFITDAMVAYFANEAEEGSWTAAPIAIINAGGIRTSINKGDISFNDLATSQPFGNTVDTGKLQGKYIRELMESAAMPYNSKRVYADVNLIQVSGIRVVIDVSKPLGSRVTSLKVRCSKCDIPRFEDIDNEEFYNIALGSFLVTGGDGFSMITDNIVDHKVGPIDTDILIDYIKQQTPIITGLDERITIVGGSTKVLLHD